MRGLLAFWLLWLAVALFVCHAHAETKRNPEIVREFHRTHICPGTGQTGRCRGYVVDHIQALCDGGPDTVSNMQYQSIADGKTKDKTECKSEYAKQHRKK